MGWDCVAPKDEKEGWLHMSGDGDEQKDWSRTPLPLLVEHILEVHHGQLKRQMEQMRELLGEVMQMDAWRSEEVGELERIYRAFESELVFHLTKEERMVFPTIRRLATEGATDGEAMKSVLELLAGEHGHGVELLTKMRRMTGSFEPYQDASASYRAMMECLKAMEAGLGPHEELEDRVLFPRVLALCEAYDGRNVDKAEGMTRREDTEQGRGDAPGEIALGASRDRR